MVIIPTLKHNAFKEVVIPRPSALVKAFGLTRPGTKFSADKFLNPSDSKIDNLTQVARENEEYEKEYADEDYNKDE